jgi:hypothetical protein
MERERRTQDKDGEREDMTTQTIYVRQSEQKYVEEFKFANCKNRKQIACKTHSERTNEFALKERERRTRPSAQKHSFVAERANRVNGSDYGRSEW